MCGRSIVKIYSIGFLYAGQRLDTVVQNVQIYFDFVY